MYKYYNTAARLAAWRKWRAEIAGAYAKRGETGPADGPLPPAWFGQLSPATPNREPYDSDKKTPRGPTYNYGEGLGPDISASHPFRFVGYADDIDGGPDHTGWFGDDEGSGFTMMRGVVFQIPARKGVPQYLAGCEWGENGAGRTFHGGGGWIEIGPGDIYTGEDGKRDAARAADSIAERAAEEERDYRREEAEREEKEAAEAAEVAEETERERLEFVDRTGGGD